MGSRTPWSKERGGQSEGTSAETCRVDVVDGKTEEGRRNALNRKSSLGREVELMVILLAPFTTGTSGAQSLAPLTMTHQVQATATWSDASTFNNDAPGEIYSISSL